MKYFLIVTALIATSCESKKSKDQAIGATGKINIVITPAQAKGPVGEALKNLLNQEMQVLPRPESIFKIRFVHPDEVNSSMRRTRNLIFVFTFSDESLEASKIRGMVSAKSLEEIRQDTSEFMRSISDVYARNQEVMYLFGRDENSLARKIELNGQQIVQGFNHTERQRLNRGILSASSTKNLVQSIAKDHSFTLKVPFGYRLADNQKDFVWLRQINPADDKDIFIAKKKYESQDDFKKENLIKFRNSVCRKYLFEDPEQPDSYLITETSVEDKEVQTREFNFGGRYAVEMKGLWKTNINTMGGPFQGFAFVDDAKGLFYYIEGFTYCPSKDQREIMRELETILYSFKVL